MFEKHPSANTYILSLEKVIPARRHNIHSGSDFIGAEIAGKVK